MQHFPQVFPPEQMNLLQLQSVHEKTEMVGEYCL